MHRADGLLAGVLILRAGEAGDAKVHDLDPAVRQKHDVLGLDVPVDDALLVGMVQRVQHLLAEVDHLFPGEGAAPAVHVFLQGDAVDVLHHDELEPVGDRDVVDLDDVGVVQNGDGLGFVLEAPHQFGVLAELLPQNLHRHHSVGLEVSSFIDVGHAAHAHQAFQQVAALQFFADQFVHFNPPWVPPLPAQR